MIRNRNIVLHSLSLLSFKIRNKLFFVLASFIFIISCKTADVTLPQANQEIMADLSSLNVQSPWADYKGSATLDFDIKHVALDLIVDLDSPLVKGTAELILEPYFFDQTMLVLDANRMTIQKIMIDDAEWNLYDYDSTSLYIELPRAYQKGETVICKIEYALNEFAVPAQAKATDSGGIFLVNYWENQKPQLWTQGETNFTSYWYPTIDHPNQRYTQLFKLTVKDHLSTLSNGVLKSEISLPGGWRQDTWQLNKPHAPYLSMIAVGPFEKVRLDDDLETDLLAADSAINTVAKVFERTPQMISFFEEKFGVEFTWPAYHQIVAKDYISGAMENTGAVVFLEDILLSNQEQQIRHFDDYISHELAHHWFGNLVTCESWANLALNESFATYSEQLWNEYYYGQDSADLLAFRELNLYLEESLTKKEDLIRYYYEDADADLFDSHSYAKGSRILHMLRMFVGDDAFFESIKLYLKQNSFQSVEVHDLRKAFESVTGLDLSWFFQQWMLNAGHPELDVSHYVENDTLYLEVNQTQRLVDYPVYYLPLYLDVYWESGVLSYPITIENQRHVFTIPAINREMKALVLDPDYQLVGTINHTKSTQELTQQALQANEIVGRYEAYIKLLNDSTLQWIPEQVVEKMLNEKNEMLLVEVLDRLGNSTNVKLKNHLPVLSTLSHHKNPQVRASALILLDILDKGVDWSAVFREDATTYVKGLALENLLPTYERSVKLAVIDSLKNSRDLNMLLPLTFAINDEFDDGFGDWYQAKINGTKSPDQYYLLAGYNEYLLDAPQNEKFEAIPFLTKYAKYHIDTDTRLTAFEGLILLSSAVPVKNSIDEIIGFEKNKQLVALYQRFYP